MLDASAHARACAARLPNVSWLRPDFRSLERNLRVTDRNGIAVSSGMSGEVRVRGAQIMQGYWKMPDETAEFLADGWFRTAISARIDEHGYCSSKIGLKDSSCRVGKTFPPRKSR